MMPQQPMQSFAKPKKSRLWLVIFIIVALVVVAGVLYTLRSQIPFIQQYVSDSVSPGDDVAAIEQDLQAVNLSGLGSELSDIDKELTQ